MQSYSYSHYYLISLSLLAAVLLTLAPLPSWALWARPHWVLLVLLFWLMAAPFQVSVGIAFLMGFLIDLATGALLGQHAFAYTLIAYLVVKICLRFRHISFYQQVMLIVGLVGLNVLLDYVLNHLLGALDYPLAWLSIVTSVIIWPWISWLLRECKYDTEI